MVSNFEKVFLYAVPLLNPFLSAELFLTAGTLLQDGQIVTVQRKLHC
jgi:hypothetical protein